MGTFLRHSVLTPGLSWRLALHYEKDQENSSQVQCIYTVYAHYILNLLTLLELLQAGKSLALTFFIILAWSLCSVAWNKSHLAV